MMRSHDGQKRILPSRIKSGIALESRPVMFSPDEVEIARIEMAKARKAIDEYESIHGYASSLEHVKLVKNFNKSAESYLVMSNASFVKLQMTAKKKK
jgi:hypothetical protein